MSDNTQQKTTKKASEKPSEKSVKKKRHWFKKLVVSILFFLLIIIVLTLSLLVWLSSTQKGLQQVVSWANDAAPMLSIEKVEGRLIGPLIIEGLTLNTDTLALTQKRLALEWTPTALFNRQIIVDSLTLDDVELTLTENSSSENNEPAGNIPDDIGLPYGISFALRNLQINNLVINSTERYQIDSISLRANTSESQYQLEQLTVASNWIDLSVQALLGTQKPFAITSNADLRLSIGKLLGEQYAQINTSLLIDGNTDRLSLTQSIQAPYNTSIDAIAESLLDDVILDLAISFENTVLARISQSLPAYSITTDLALKGSPTNFALTSNGDIVLDESMQFDYTLRSSNNSNIFTINQLAIKPRPNTNNSRIELMGLVDITGNEPTVKLNSKWNNIAWPINNTTQSNELAFYSPKGSLTVDGSVKQLKVTLDSLIGDKGIIKANISGKNVNQAQRSLDAVINWEDLHYPLTVSEESSLNYRSQKGRLSLAGNQDNYRIQLNSAVSTSVLSSTAEEFIDGTINLLGKGTLTSFELASLSVKPTNANTQSSQLTGTGSAQFTRDFSTLTGQFNLQGVGINPALLLQDWPGDLNLELTLDAQKKGDNLRAAINTLRVDGQLREYPLKAEAQAVLNNQVLEIPKLSLQSGESLLEANGRFSEELLDARWNLVSEDLSHFYPDVKGSITAAGEVNGSVEKPIVKTNFEANNIVFNTLAIENINALLDVDLSSQNSQSDINISANNLLVNEFQINNIDVDLNGSLDQHTLSLTTDTEQGQLDKRLTGSVVSVNDTQEWKFLLEQLDIAPLTFKPWQLQSTTQGKINLLGATIEPLCLSSDRNSVCVDTIADFTNEKLEANLTIDQLGFDYLAPLLAENIEIENIGIAGNARISLVNNSLNTVNVALATQAGSIQVPLLEETNQNANEDNNLFNNVFSSDDNPTEEQEVQWVSLLMDKGKINVALENNQLDLNGDIPFNWFLGSKDIPTPSQNNKANTDQGLRFLLQTSGPENIALNEQALKGQLNLNVYDLDPIIALMPQLLVVPSEQEKSLRANMEIGGNFNEPNIEGSVALNNLALTVIDAGITLSDIQTEISSSSAGIIDFIAKISSRPTTLTNRSTPSNLAAGRLSIKGAAEINDNPKLTMNIEGNQFQLVNTSELQLVASPLMTIEADRDRVDINGELAIPSALFAPNKIQSSAISASSDQIIVSDTPEDNSQLPDVFANVRIALGDDVKVDSFGFKGDITGGITAVARPNSPTTGSGKLNILNGEYRAYGQGLVIERGQILFNGGNIEQPGVDIRAKRNPAENITVGIIAQGEIREPNFSLFSEPAMTQTEQLSWLILGRSLSESSSGEGNALSQLALSFGLSAGDDFLQNFNGKLGIDSIAIETGSGEAGAFSDNDQAALTLGKYLTPKLYLSYGIGLFDALDTIKLEYLINSNFKIATESSSAANGADIIYNIGTD